MSDDRDVPEYTDLFVLIFGEGPLYSSKPIHSRYLLPATNKKTIREMRIHITVSIED